MMTKPVSLRRIPDSRHSAPRRLAVVASLLLTGLAAGTADAAAGNYTDPSGYPGNWPATWVDYTYKNVAVIDGVTGSDTSTGGTTPTGAADVTNNSLTASYIYGDGSNVFFRFRLGGPPLALTGAGQPFTPVTWSVLIDVDGDGYREFIVQLDGDDAGPSSPMPDDLYVLYNNADNNTFDQATDTIWKQDAAKHPSAANGSDGEPDSALQWDWDADPYVWDYKRTRVVQIDTGLSPGHNNSEYFLDLQVPIAALDAAGRGGPTLNVNSVFAYGFASANSNSNPFQKDLVYNGSYVAADTSYRIPFGDIVTGNNSIYQAPSVTLSSTSSGCSSAVTLNAYALDTYTVIGGVVSTTVQSATFHYYRDIDGNGAADDGQSWTLVGSGNKTNNVSPWTFVWDPTGLLVGQYLIKVVVTDDQGHTVDSTDVDPASATYNRGTATFGGPVQTSFSNLACGTWAPPVASKAFSPASIGSGDSVTLTVTLRNPNGAAIAGAAFSDIYPAPALVHAATPNPQIGGVGCTGTLTALGSPERLVLSNGSIPAGGSCSYSVTVTSATLGDHVNSTGPVTTTQAGTGTAASATLTVLGKLVAGKSFSPAAIPTAGASVLTITLRNPNGVAVTGVAFGDLYPADLTNGAGATPSATPAGCTGTLTAPAGGNSLTLTDGTVPPATTCSYAVQVTGATAGSHVNHSGSIASANAGSSTEATASLLLVAPPNVTVLKSTATVSDPANGSSNPHNIPGAIVRYTVQVGNFDSVSLDAGSLVLTDQLPPGTSLVIAEPVVTIDNDPAATGLSIAYGNRGDLADQVEFSSDGSDFATHVPADDGSGAAPATRYLRLRPSGAFLGGGQSFTLRFDVRLE